MLAQLFCDLLFFFQFAHPTQLSTIVAFRDHLKQSYNAASRLQHRLINNNNK